jgi:TolB-like protein
MLSSLLALTLLGAEPPPPIKVAAMRLSVLGLGEGKADFYTDHFADRLGERGIAVVTPREISAVLGLEGQRAMLGCDELATSCLVEVAAALGADAVSLGDVARVGSGFQVNVKLIAARDGRRLAVHSARVEREDDVPVELARAARELAVQLARALGRPVPDAALAGTVEGGGARRWWWVPAALGAVGAGVGVWQLVTAEGARQQLATQTLPRAQADAVLAAGQQARTIGFVGVGFAAAAAVATVVLVAAGGPTTPAPVVSIAPGAVMVGLSARLP